MFAGPTSPALPAPAHLPEGTTLQPARGFYLVCMDKVAEKSPGGIHLSGKNRDKYTLTGTVISVGPGRWHPMSRETIEPLYSVDDMVVFLTWCNMQGMAVNIGNETVGAQVYILCDEKDIAARVSVLGEMPKLDDDEGDGDEDEMEEPAPTSKLLAMP